jgi:hypothetical protein
MGATGSRYNEGLIRASVPNDFDRLPSSRPFQGYERCCGAKTQGIALADESRHFVAKHGASTRR